MLKAARMAARGSTRAKLLDSTFAFGFKFIDGFQTLSQIDEDFDRNP
jgi:hypothetical protein